MNFVRAFCLGTLLFFAIGMPRPSLAQDDPNFETGMKSFGSYHGGDIDTIDLTQGSLSVDIPLVSYPQRGGKLKLDFVLHYENRGNYVDAYYDDDDDLIVTDYSDLLHGWDIIERNVPSEQRYPTSANFPSTGAGCVGDSPYIECYPSVEMQDGPIHSFMPVSLSTWRATDASGFMAAFTGSVWTYAMSTVTDRDGITYTIGGQTYPSLIEDPNGNEITYSNSSGWTDTKGVSIPPVPSALYQLPIESILTGMSTDSTNCTGSLTNFAFSWEWDPPGYVDPIKFCYVAVTEQASNDGYDIYGSYTSYQLQSVVFLNNGTAYTFQYTSVPTGSGCPDYDATHNKCPGGGDLSQITLPSGGTIAYTWTMPPTFAQTHYYIFNRGVATRTLNDGASSAEWTYAYSGSTTSPPYTSTTTVTSPDSNNTVHTFTAIDNDPSAGWYETETQYYQGTSTLLKTLNKTYSFTTWSLLGPQNIVANQDTTVWPTSQQSQVAYGYDNSTTFRSNSFLISSWGFSSSTTYTGGTLGTLLTKGEYDYGSGAVGSLIRTTTTSYLESSDSHYLDNNLLALPSSVQVTDSGSTQRAYTTYAYDGVTLDSSGVSTSHNSSPPAGTYRGNLTSLSRWLSGSTTSTTECPISVSNGYLVSYTTPYDTGMAHKTVDQCGSSATDSSHMTTYTYESTGTFPTEIQYPTTGSIAHTEHFTNDANFGLLLSHTDQNSQVAYYGYDSMLRPTSVTYPDGGVDTWSYTDTTPNPYFVFTKSITSSSNFVEKGIVDGLGRLIETDTTVPSTTCLSTHVYVDSAYSYDSTNHVWTQTVSNPDCSTSHTYNTVTKYDTLNRVTSVTKQDGGTVSYAYAGSCTTVTDEASKVRKSCLDGPGRMTGLWEDPSVSNYETDYSYDVLDNLAGVSQGSQTRSFSDDSLSHLTSASNPESNTTSYTYDADGNVATKTDARSITTTYSYDALNRLLEKDYSDGSPAMSYWYDACPTWWTGCGLTNMVGRVIESRNQYAGTYGSGTDTINDYDAMGRIVAQCQQTPPTAPGGNWMYFGYDLAGNLNSLTYPSGKTVTYTVNVADQPLSAVDSGDSINYVTTSTLYDPSGGLTSLSNGAYLLSTYYYNSRLQPCRIAANSSGTAPNSCTDSSHTGNVLDLVYDFSSGSSDNGNVVGIANKIDSTRSQTFTYDSLNRIATAAASNHATSPSHCFGESYTIDRYGNLTGIGSISSSYTGCTQENLSLSVSSTTNRITTSGFTYDSAGDMTSDGTNSPTYDAEGHMISDAGVTYAYDALGHRVNKSSGTAYLYTLDGQVLAELDSGGSVTNEYIYFGRKRIARRDSSGNVDYYFSDDLNSARVVTNTSGTIQDDSDFYPFGGERVVSGASGNKYKFTGKERDSESNLDNFGARFYSSQYGRFMTPDWSSLPAPVPYANLTNPQTLNLYAIVHDNPETFADLDGHDDGSTAVAEPEAAETAEEATAAAEVEEGAEEGAEAGSEGGPVGVAVGVTVGIGVAVGTYEYEKHFRNPGPPPGPMAPKPPSLQSAAHKKDARPSTKEDHEAGQTRQKRDARGGEKGDKRREEKGMFPRKRPAGYPKKGPWPPKPPDPPAPPPPPPPPTDKNAVNDD